MAALARALKVATPPRRPLLGFAIAFLGGSVWGLLGAPPVWVLILGAAGSLVASLATRRGALLLFLAAALVGCLRADQSLHPPGAPTLAERMDREAETLAVRGVVHRDPVFRRYETGADEAEDGVWMFPIWLESVNRLGEFEPVGGIVRASWRRPPEGVRPRYGDRWEFYGVVRKAAEDKPDRSDWMRINSDGTQRIATDQGMALMSWCLRARESCSHILEHGLHDRPDHIALLKALLLGYRADLPRHLEERFSLTGTLHIFAISGLHVGVMAMLMVGVLKTLGMSRVRWVVVLIPFLLVYTMTTGMKASAVRACVMALTYWSATLVGRKPDAPSALALAALLIVAWEPTQVISVGFILSFVVVSGILLIFPILNEPGKRWFVSDPWQRGPDVRWVRIGRATGAKLWSLLALSIACWATSFPLTAMYFNIQSPVALLCNVFVVPMAFLIVLTGCLTLITGSLSVFLAEVFNHANSLFVGGLLRAIEGMAAVPGGHRFIPSPHWGWAVVWYGAVALWIAARAERRWWWGGAIVFGASVWTVCYPWQTSLMIDALPANGVTLLHVNASAREHVLVDTGSRRDEEDLRDALRRAGVNRVRMLIISRCEPAHCGGAASFIQSVPVDEILVGAVTDPELLAEIQQAARERLIPVRLFRAGDGGYLRDGTEWEVLAPRVDHPTTDPALIRFARDDLSVLLMSGSGLSLEYSLSQSLAYPRADVLVISDRSFGGSLYPDWLMSVGPRHVLHTRKSYQYRSDDYAPLERQVREMGIEIIAVEPPGVRLQTAVPPKSIPDR